MTAQPRDRLAALLGDVASGTWVAQTRPVLEQVARTYEAYITYAELADAVQEAAGIRTGMPFRHWIGKVLGAVARNPGSPHEPMLTSLVVKANGRVGDGYKEPVKERDGVEPGRS